MIGDIAVEPKPAKPSICQIEVDFLAQAPLRADAETVTHDQHPDHQFWIDRWATNRTVEGGQLPPQRPKLHKPVDGP
jgi:hypothetical protein